MKNQRISPIMLTTLTATLLASCAGPESYQQKMARYTPKTFSKNQVPEIVTSDFKFAPTPSKAFSRAPASASASVTPDIKETEKEGNPTNKKLYFLSLYSQYETLKKYSSEFEAPSVSICPNFHTSLLRHNEKVSATYTGNFKNKKFTYDSKKYSDDSFIASHPELLLPLSKDEITPKVVDVIRSSKTPVTEASVNEMVHKAIDIHLSKTYSEIRELCEYGVSDNYYIYENLITHIKNNKFEAGTSNMNTLLKTTLFSNMALTTSLEKQTPVSGRSIASIGDDAEKSPYTKEVMARLNVKWAAQYFDYIKESH